MWLVKSSKYIFMVSHFTWHIIYRLLKWKKSCCRRQTDWGNDNLVCDYWLLINIPVNFEMSIQTRLSHPLLFCGIRPLPKWCSVWCDSLQGCVHEGNSIHLMRWLISSEGVVWFVWGPSLHEPEMGTPCRAVCQALSGLMHSAHWSETLRSQAWWMWEDTLLRRLTGWL